MSWIGALAGLGGSLGSSAMSLWNSGKQHERNKEMVKYVGENAHQWEVNDLRNAGLNPIISSGGSGNAGGSSPTSFVPSDVGSAFNSGRQLGQQARIGKEQEKLLKEQQETQKATTAKEKALGELYDSQARHSRLDLNYYTMFPELKRGHLVSNAFGQPTAMADLFVNSASSVLGKLGGKESFLNERQKFPSHRGYDETYSFGGD